MKKLLFSTVALTGLLAASLSSWAGCRIQAGRTPPPPLMGSGFYGGIDMERIFFRTAVMIELLQTRI